MPSIEDLTSTRPTASPAEIRSEMMRQMGEDMPRPPRPQPYPDMSGWAEEWGLVD